jgi:GntR family transcriptional regulator / MocR family aminotransferase
MVLVTLDGQGRLADQIYQSIRRAILEGALRPGSRLPPTRVLADEVGAARNTVLLAYEHLLAEGYAVGRVGAGTYVAASLPEAPLAPARHPVAGERTGSIGPRALSAFGRRLLVDGPVSALPVPPRPVRYDFRYGLPALDAQAVDLWCRLGHRRLRSRTPDALGYGPPEGHRPLREALADYLRRARGVVCRAEQILVVNGSQQALDLAARVLVDPGDSVAIEEPHYLGARRAFVAAGAALVPVPVDADGLDPARLPRAGGHLRLAYLTPSHQFPTGAVLSLARRLALLEWARRTRTWVIEDDYDSEYRYAGRPIEALQGLDRSGRVLYVGTLSKVLFPALRLGYLVLPEPLVDPFVRAKALTDRHTPTFEQEVLADLIGEGHFERHLRRTRTRNAAQRAALLDAFASHLGDRVEVGGANAGVHVVAWLRNVRPSRLPELIETAARADVGVYPVTPHYLTPPRRAGLLLGYVSMSEPEIREGIRRLAGVIAGHGPRRGRAPGAPPATAGDPAR